MKAIILAAGSGTRLGTLQPKCLTKITETESILDFQVKQLTKSVGLHNIMIIVGYKKELIMEKYPDLTFLYNEAFAHNNTAKSLLKAVNKIQNEDVIWMNGDVYFEIDVLQSLINSGSSSVLVDTKKCGEEEIKYTVNEKGYIQEISKQVKNALGEGLGINLLKAKDIEKFRNELENVGEKDYFEKALENLTLAGKMELLPVDKAENFCQEIDFPQDLEVVRKYLNQSK